MIAARPILLLCLLAFPARAVAESDCAAQVDTLTKWLDLAKEDQQRGAILAERTDKFVAAPLQKHEAPKMPMMTLVVEKSGVRDKPGPTQSIDQVKSVIESNVNFTFARDNANAISRGILVAGEKDASAGSVKKAAAAASASGEKVWLVFRPSDAKIKAPPKSKVGDELAKLSPTEMMAIVQIIRREFEPCEGLIAMMSKMGGQTMATRLDTLINSTAPAVKRCDCKTSGATAAAILWGIAFRELAVAIPVDAAKIDKLPWGDAKKSWADAAPAIIKALSK